MNLKNVTKISEEELADITGGFVEIIIDPGIVAVPYYIMHPVDPIAVPYYRMTPVPYYQMTPAP